MSVPTAITDLSTTASSNSPTGSENPKEGDNHLRAGYSFIRTLYNWLTDGLSAITCAAFTAKGNVILGDAATDTLNVGAGGIVKDASGNTSFGGSVAFTLGGTSGGLRFGGSTVTTALYDDGAGNVYLDAVHGSATSIPLSVRTKGVNGDITLSPNGNVALRLTGAGAIQDGAGLELGYRDIPRVTGSIERGKCFATSSNVTLGSAAAGYTYSIYNDSASAITIADGGTTLRLAGTTSTGSRTLAPRGMATLWFNTTNEIIISGAGLY